MSRNRDIDRFDQREPGCKRERLGRRIAGSKLDQGAAVEIAFRRDPGPSLPSPARFLMKSNQPVAFDSLRVSDQVGVG